MFKLKYNILVMIQVILNAANTFLLIKIFGISPQTDAYFMLQTVFMATYLIQFMPIEQFMFFYNDTKVESREYAEKFYNFALFISSLTGVVSVAIFSVFLNFIINIFAYKLDAERAILLSEYMSIYKWGLLFTPANYVCVSLLTAEMKIGYSYITAIIPIFFTILAQVFCYFSGYNDILFIIIAGLSGIILGTFLNFMLIKKYFNYEFTFSFEHKLSWKYIKNSFMMRLGHNIHNFFYPLITNNFLSAFPSGFVSYFYYAQKIVSVLQNIITGPSSKILQSKISHSCSLNYVKGVKNDIKHYFKIFPLFFIFAVLITYWIIPVFIKLTSIDNLSVFEVKYIQSIFVVLAFWNLVIFIESPFDMILMAVKNSRIFIYVNTLYILNYSMLLFFLKDKYGINTIGIALISSQIVNLFFYSNSALKVLDSNQKGMLKKIFEYIKNKVLYQLEVI